MPSPRRTRSRFDTAARVLLIGVAAAAVLAAVVTPGTTYRPPKQERVSTLPTGTYPVTPPGAVAFERELHRLQGVRGGAATVGGGGRCRYRAGGALPDLSCTPGAVNGAVTQATIATTICVPGWTATVRPGSNVTGPMKLVAMRVYGYAFGTSPRGYEYDHLVPLEIGGAPADPRNLWPMPHRFSFAKDSRENWLHARVCGHTMTLAAARRIMRTDWRRGG